MMKSPAGSKLVDYLLADIGEGIAECEIVKWFVEPGAMVEEFDVLVEVQSDKASVEITSRYAGRLAEHCYKVGEVAKVGSALCKIEVDVEEGKEADLRPAVKQVKNGCPAKEGLDGNADRHSASLEEEALPKFESGIQTDSLHGSRREGKHGAVNLATPAVRRVIRECGVNIDDVKGTGKAGRVTKEDVQAYMTSQASSSSLPSASPPISEDENQSDKVVAISGTRKAMCRAMNETWKIPHFGYSEEIDITKLNQIRKETQSMQDEVKLTLLPFLLKALSLAMHNHGIFRSIFDSTNLTLREKEEHRISIALSSPRGLLTPTLASDMRSTSVLEIAQQVHTLQRISSERGLNREEMGSGSTITLSNIGSIGGVFTFPLLPPTGQLIIGAMGKSRLLPRFDDHGNLVKALILPVSFSADHRVVEGVELARFVQEWKDLIENPTHWLLKLK
ncbi:hypothetical protein CBS101457_005531 [Exobasidium rhododendri]|nr:hypothetical protein CBS101457_005531 [Exobasidium rhododendri]